MSGWPLHDIAITAIVWCIAYTREVGWGSYIAQWPCNSNAIGQVGGVGAIEGRLTPTIKL